MCELLYFFFNVFINFYTRLIKYICMSKKELDKILILQRERHTSYQQPPFSLSLKMKQDAVLIVLEL